MNFGALDWLGCWRSCVLIGRVEGGGRRLRGTVKDEH